MSTLTSPHKTRILYSWRTQGERNDCGAAAPATIRSALRKTNWQPGPWLRSWTSPATGACWLWSFARAWAKC